MIRTKQLALSIGYQIQYDLPFGFTLGLGHRSGKPAYRLIISFAFDWPKVRWAAEDWAMGETGFIRGMPVWRPGINSSAWTGRRWHVYAWWWPRYWSVSRYD